MKKITAYSLSALLLLGVFSVAPVFAEEILITESQPTETVLDSSETLPESTDQSLTQESTETVNTLSSENTNQLTIAEVTCTDVYPTTSVSGGTATITLPDGACPLKVTFASYSHTGLIKPLEDQVLVDYVTGTYGPGTTNIGPLDLSCNWQTDLYSGDVQPNLLPPPYETGTPKGLTTGTILYNYDFVENQTCGPMTLTVIKNVVGGTATSGDFMISVTGGSATPSSFQGNASGTTVSINASSTYSVTEVAGGPSNYTVSYSADCTGVSTDSLTPKTCVVTNTFTPPGCTAINPTGTVDFANATLVVPEGACPIMVSFSSYTFATTIVPYDQQILVDNITDTYGPGTYHIGPLKLECNWQTDLYVGPVQEHLLAIGGHDQSQGPVLGYNYMENQVCGDANIIVTKIVINDNGGTKQVSDFPLMVGTTTVSSGATTTMAAGSYTVSETYDSSLYAQSFSGDCDSSGNITLSASTTKTCVITNNDIDQTDDNDGGGSSTRRRHRGGGIVLGVNTEPQPEVLGVTLEPTIPGLPNTGSGPLTSTGSNTNNAAILFFGVFTLLALNTAAIISVKRRVL